MQPFRHMSYNSKKKCMKTFNYRPNLNQYQNIEKLFDGCFIFVEFDFLIRLQAHLVLPSMLHYLLIDDLIHDLKALDGLLLRDADVSLLQGHRAETAQTKIHPC